LVIFSPLNSVLGAAACRRSRVYVFNIQKFNALSGRLRLDQLPCRQARRDGKSGKLPVIKGLPGLGVNIISNIRSPATRFGVEIIDERNHIVNGRVARSNGALYALEFLAHSSEQH
jgi:hypothetical protein